MQSVFDGFEKQAGAFSGLGSLAGKAVTTAEIPVKNLGKGVKEMKGAYWANRPGASSKFNAKEIFAKKQQADTAAKGITGKQLVLGGTALAGGAYLMGRAHQTPQQQQGY